MNNKGTDAGEVASDNYYLPDAVYQSLPTDGSRNAYLWKSDILIGASNNDWINEYNVVYNANVVLETILKIERNVDNEIEWDNCKGQALLFRAKSFFEIAQVWSKAYDSSTATTDLGIPLRLISDFNVLSTRANIQATYNQIISDAKAAIPLLPNSPIFVYRPSKPAAYALLARTYLAMRDYLNAKIYAELCLQIKSDLLDYNSLSSPLYPFSGIQFSNREDIMHTVCGGANTRNLRFSNGRIDSLLYQSYDSNDLRKIVFFSNYPDNSFWFQGSYDGATTLNYNGIATDEMYLIVAECGARQGNIIEAMNKLNMLLVKRWKTGTFNPVTAGTISDALNKILLERRKELVYRMLRFTDIKRLNKEGANIKLKRVIQNQIYTLPPNDPRYALPIPNNVIQATGMPQN